MVSAFNGIFRIGITDLFTWALITISTLMISIQLELVRSTQGFYIRNDFHANLFFCQHFAEKSEHGYSIELIRIVLFVFFSFLLLFFAWVEQNQKFDIKLFLRLSSIWASFQLWIWRNADQSLWNIRKCTLSMQLGPTPSWNTTHVLNRRGKFTTSEARSWLCEGIVWSWRIQKCTMLQN